MALFLHIKTNITPSQRQKHLNFSVKLYQLSDIFIFMILCIEISKYILSYLALKHSIG